MFHIPLHPALLQYVAVGIGGCIGAMLRYYILTIGTADDQKYLYTLLINVSGCFFIGVIWVILTALGAKTVWFTLIISGIIGGYTTYSSFSLDFTTLLHQQRVLEALFYALATVLTSISGCVIGYFVTTKICRLLGADI